MSVVEYEVRDKIAYITLNRPEKLNAINPQLFDELVAICDKYEEDPDAWVAILSGKGRAFCTGMDLVQTPSERPSLAFTTDQMYYRLMTVKKPLIAAVHGYCLAQGDGIAFSCDIIVAAEGTKFGWPQAKRGISSISGPSLGMFCLPRHYAFEFLFTARMFDAEEAYRLNLINRVVPEDQLMVTAESIARDILDNSPSSVWGMKRAIILGADNALRQRMQIAAEIAKGVHETEDAKEGLRAFAEKRQPKFTGK